MFSLVVFSGIVVNVSILQSIGDFFLVVSISLVSFSALVS